MMNDQHVPAAIKDYLENSPDFAMDRYSSKGGLGHLYFGTRNITLDRVALKFYELTGDKNDHAEPIALRKISDENILPILDARYISDKIAFHVTPEIDGGDLDHYLKGRFIHTHEAIQIAYGILRGLNTLHSEPYNWVHMDLKGGNILIDASNNKPYIADFGSVKKLLPDKDYAENGQSTLYYMPPELIRDGRHYRQSDIYQVGVIFFKLLHGAFPVDTPDRWLGAKKRNKLYKLATPQSQKDYFERQVKDKIVRGKLLDLKSLPVYVGGQLKKILRKALDPDFHSRYPNCPAFQKALYDYQKQSKDWWIEDSHYYARCKIKERYYKLMVMPKSVLIQSSPDQQKWRKKQEMATLEEAVDYVNAQ
jgi:serine/threonine protein kinase